MDTNVSPSAISVVLLLMAAASLCVMLSLNQINYIVHGDLYNYGLQFSYRWAMPYWILSGAVFGLSWTNITIAIVVTVYLFRKSRKQGAPTASDYETERTDAADQFEVDKEQRKMSEFLRREKGIAVPREDNASQEVIKEAVVLVEEKADAPKQQQQVTAQATVAGARKTEAPEPQLIAQEADKEKQPTQ